MSRFARLAASAFLLLSAVVVTPAESTPASAKRLVILKIDGLNADLLYDAMAEKDPATGKSRLPWFQHVFGENGTVFDNFYTRGITLSAPSWSMLGTGYHTVIRGNVEYDRYTGEAYDYLNFFPFYVEYARSKEVDMPGVEVLDRAGVPLLMDSFGFVHSYQGFQLFQRGVRWRTLNSTLKKRFSGKVIFSMIESGETPSLDSVLLEEEEVELERGLASPEIVYLDYFTGDVDHEGHETTQPAALYDAMRRLDAVVGRIWTAIQQSPYAAETLFAVVSDHGMNNVPGVMSQTFSLPDLFNSPDGGGHHVVTDREQFSDFKLRGLNPMRHRVTTPSTASFYLKGQAEQYATAWLDIDGNERAAVQLRNSDLNEIHILLQQLQRPDLAARVRAAAAATLKALIDRHRAAWEKTAEQMTEEMQALAARIAQRKKQLEDVPRKWTHEDEDNGNDKEARRLIDELAQWEHEHSGYTSYVAHLRALLEFQSSPDKPLQRPISELVPALSLGDSNSVHQLEHYVIALSPGGLVVGQDGHLDEERSFKYVNYFELLAAQKVHNNPQKELSPKPIDFTAMRLPDGLYVTEATGPQHAYLLYGDAASQLVILTDVSGLISVRPVKELTQDQSGKITWTDQPWRAGLPLQLFEDPRSNIPSGENRAAWLSAWHSEHEWMEAIHQTRYSNGVIGITEQLSPVADNVPGPRGTSPVLLRYERRRRELVQADFHVFAADHWNFNVRFPNPGGNHGAFFRISTHSVWMMNGPGIPVEHITEPYDSLNFASTIMSRMGCPPPMPGKVVPLP
ncbi:MAG: alkaline phosphatase family protein [Acidobacteriaceae bacterium]|nr:alkaline phosphatase family protein [Acidobacteriaceae bacterium]